MFLRLLTPLFFTFALSIGGHEAFSKPSDTLALSDTCERSMLTHVAHTAGDLAWKGTAGTASYVWKGVKTILTKPAHSFVVLAAMMSASRGAEALSFQGFPPQTPFEAKYFPDQACPSSSTFNVGSLIDAGQSGRGHLIQYLTEPHKRDDLCSHARIKFLEEQNIILEDTLKRCGVTDLSVQANYAPSTAHIHCPGYYFAANNNLNIESVLSELSWKEIATHGGIVCSKLSKLTQELKGMKKNERYTNLIKEHNC